MAGLAASGATVACGGLAYAWRVEPHWVSITRLDMPFRGLDRDLVGKRIVQISDLHVGPIVDGDYLRGVLRRLPELEPDYLVITGDFLTSNHGEQIGPAIEMLRESPVVEMPCIATLGNHDYSDSFRNGRVAAELADRLRGIGVTVLRNESTEVDGLQFAGSDDLWAGRCSLYRTLQEVDHSRPAVVLSHNPDSVDLPEWTTFGGWVLSGHTHGGQCRFPLIGAPVMPIRNHRYQQGHVAISGGRNLYVNRGLGYSRRIRFGARPEVTVFTLRSA